jgi:hypothetical protein
MTVDSVLFEFIRKNQIPIFGIASSDGFKHPGSGWHPVKIMPGCKNVVVFGCPFVKHSLYVDQKTHIANESWWRANDEVTREVANCFSVCPFK